MNLPWSDRDPAHLLQIYLKDIRHSWSSGLTATSLHSKLAQEAPVTSELLRFTEDVKRRCSNMDRKRSRSIWTLQVSPAAPITNNQHSILWKGSSHQQTSTTRRLLAGSGAAHSWPSGHNLSGRTSAGSKAASRRLPNLSALHHRQKSKFKLHI